MINDLYLLHSAIDMLDVNKMTEILLGGLVMLQLNQARASFSFILAFLNHSSSARIYARYG